MDKRRRECTSFTASTRLLRQIAFQETARDSEKSCRALSTSTRIIITLGRSAKGKLIFQFFSSSSSFPSLTKFQNFFAIRNSIIDNKGRRRRWFHTIEMHDDASHFRSATIFHARTFHVPSREILRFAKRTRTVNRVERPTTQGRSRLPISNFEKIAMKKHSTFELKKKRK